MPEAGSTERDTVRIVNQKGLHARASAKFVGLVTALGEEYDVTVSRNGAEDSAVPGNSILDLMMLGAAQGDVIEIAVTGPDADSAVLRLVGLVKDGFGED